MFNQSKVLPGGGRGMGKFYVMMALFFSIPLFPKLTSILIILYALLTLPDFNKCYFTKLFKQKGLLVFILIYVLLIVGLSYTTSFESGVSKVQTQLAFLIFPLFLGGAVVTVSERNWYLNSFVAGVFAAALICISHAFYRVSTIGSWYVVDEFSRKHNVFFYNELSDFINLHPTYFAIYLGLAVFFLLVQFFKKKKPFLAVLAILLFVMLFLTSSKSGIFSFLIVTAIFLGYKILKHRRKIDFVIGLGIVTACFAMFAINPMISERSMSSATSIYELTEEPGNLTNESTSIRLGMWNLSLEAAKKAPLFGHGTGSVWKSLNDVCLNSYSFSICENLRNKNSHNQYLNFLVSNGILVCLLFMIALALIVLKAFKNRDILFLFFLATMLLNFFFESLLQRERGIVFFMLFLVLFAISKNNNLALNEK